MRGGDSAKDGNVQGEKQAGGDKNKKKCVRIAQRNGWGKSEV